MPNTWLNDKIDEMANWLDENYPAWYEKIDTDRLVMSDGNFCVCGQLGMWNSGHIFKNRPIDFHPAFGTRGTTEWKRQINTRRTHIKG